MRKYTQQPRVYQSHTSRIAPRPHILDIAPRPSESKPLAPPMSITRFLGLSFLVNTPIYFIIYVLSSFFLVQSIFLPDSLISFITYISSSFLPLIIGLFSIVSIILPCLFLAFMVSYISSFIQSFLDTPIDKNPSSLLDYRITIPTLLFKCIITIIAIIPLSLWMLFSSFLTVVNYVIQNPSCLLCFPRIISPIWSFVQSYLDPFAYFFLYELPERIAHLAFCLMTEPWMTTQFLAKLVKSVLLLIGIPVNELGKGLSWIGRMLVRTGGAGHLMGTSDEGQAGGILLIVGYLVLDWANGLALSFLKNVVVSALLRTFSFL